MNKIRKKINKRIKSASLYQEETDKLMGNTDSPWQHHIIDTDLNAEEGGSRSLAFCSHVSRNPTISNVLKIQKKPKKRKRKDRLDITQESFQAKSSPTYSSVIVGEVVPCIADSFKKKNSSTHDRPKV